MEMRTVCSADLVVVRAKVPDMADGQAGEANDAGLLALFDLLGRRWSLRVIWELRTDGQTYRELAAKIPDMSTSVLTQRLRELRAAHLIEHERGSGYRLTRAGRELLGHLQGLRDWAGQIGFSGVD
jgi:DNA-binding HxlR family transcriptional regulator